MTVKLLTEHHLEFLSLKGGCTGSFESSLVKMPHCLKSHFGCWSVQHFISHDLNDLTSLYFTQSCELPCINAMLHWVWMSVCMYMHILNSSGIECEGFSLMKCLIILKGPYKLAQDTHCDVYGNIPCEMSAINGFLWHMSTKPTRVVVNGVRRCSAMCGRQSSKNF